MGLLHTERRVTTQHLIEVLPDADECTSVVDEVIDRGPQYAQRFWWGYRAVVHGVSLVDGPDLRDLREACDGALR